jgi:hypothetical protein
VGLGFLTCVVWSVDLCFENNSVKNLTLIIPENELKIWKEKSSLYNFSFFLFYRSTFHSSKVSKKSSSLSFKSCSCSYNSH